MVPSGFRYSNWVVVDAWFPKSEIRVSLFALWTKAKPNMKEQHSGYSRCKQISTTTGGITQLYFVLRKITERQLSIAIFVVPAFTLHILLVAQVVLFRYYWFASFIFVETFNFLIIIISDLRKLNRSHGRNNALIDQQIMTRNATISSATTTTTIRITRTSSALQ